MTKEELSQLRFLYQEIHFDKSRLREAQRRAKDSVFTHPENSKRFERQATALQCLLEEKILRCIEERNRLELFIQSINDSLLRQIFVLRYINGYSWTKIAFSLGETDESYVRKKHNRFLQEQKDRKMAEKSEANLL